MKKYLLILIIFQTLLLNGQEGSVVCLHGFFRSYRCMIPLGNAMRNEGLRVYLWDYPGRKRTIEQHAACLVEVLNAIAKESPGKPIYFVTHSLGGLILRAALNHPDCPPEAHLGRAVLLAPPNKGAALARMFHSCPMARWIFGNRAGQQLMTYTEKEIGDLGEFPQGMEVMVIAGNEDNCFSKMWITEPNDGKVTIEETKLTTPHHHHILPVSHRWIMTSRESMALTKKFLLKE